MGVASARGSFISATPAAQYTSIAFAETVVLESIAASIGSVGDAYDNALAESIIGLFKTEAASRRSSFLNGPMQTIDDVEFATMRWVDWFDQRRLHSTLDYLTPDKFEEVYESQEVALRPEMLQAWERQETRDGSTSGADWNTLWEPDVLLVHATQASKWPSHT